MISGSPKGQDRINAWKLDPTSSDTFVQGVRSLQAEITNTPATPAPVSTPTPAAPAVVHEGGAKNPDGSTTQPAIYNPTSRQLLFTGDPSGKPSVYTLPDGTKGAKVVLLDDNSRYAIQFTDSKGSHEAIFWTTASSFEGHDLRSNLAKFGITTPTSTPAPAPTPAPVAAPAAPVSPAAVAAATPEAHKPTLKSSVHGLPDASFDKNSHTLVVDGHTYKLPDNVVITEFTTQGGKDLSIRYTRGNGTGVMFLWTKGIPDDVNTKTVQEQLRFFSPSITEVK